MKIFPLHLPLGIDEQNLLQKNKEQQTVPHIAINSRIVLQINIAPACLIFPHQKTSELLLYKVLRLFSSGAIGAIRTSAPPA